MEKWKRRHVLNLGRAYEQTDVSKVHRQTFQKSQIRFTTKIAYLWEKNNVTANGFRRKLVEPSNVTHHFKMFVLDIIIISGLKIVINDNIIKQLTDFKYLGYRISEYGSDLEDKLQTYNKINGAIRRHFGKQMHGA